MIIKAVISSPFPWLVIFAWELCDSLAFHLKYSCSFLKLELGGGRKVSSCLGLSRADEQFDAVDGVSPVSPPTGITVMEAF